MELHQSNVCNASSCVEVTHTTCYLRNCSYHVLRKIKQKLSSGFFFFFFVPELAKYGESRELGWLGQKNFNQE